MMIKLGNWHFASRCASLVCRGAFFFFQAEDGIRDLTVTGVQTCALPISFVVRGHVAPRRAAVIGPIQSEVADQIDALRRGGVRDGNGDAAGKRRQSSAHDLAPSDAAIRGLIETRTHARRVRLW